MNRTTQTKKARQILAILLFAGTNGFADDSQKKALRIIVSIPDCKLVLVEGDRVLRVFDVAVGKAATPSPQGEFRIISRLDHPTWFGPRKVVGPGKSNPLGTRWMGLSVHGYGIHGTNVPNSIGKSASHGCIRMRNRDVEELFDLVPVGTTVELAGERTEAIQKILTVAD